MNESQSKDISVNTQTASGPRVCQRQACAGGLFRKAGVLGVMLGFSLAASLVSAGDKPQYRFDTIPLPGPGQAVGINDEGIVTGFYTDPATGDVLSFVSHHGDLKIGISGPGDTYTSIGPANNLGIESGNDGDYTNQQPVLYDIRRGTFYPLPEIEGMEINFCDGVNDFGHASGVAYATGDWVDGGNGLGLNWIWDGRKYSFFDVPGAVNGAAAGGINNQDEVTGFYIDDSGLPQGFVKDGSHYKTFAAPGSLYTLAFGINNQGVVAGGYVNPDTSHHGYFWSEGKFTTVDVTLPAANGTSWYQANDHGDLAGLYFSGSNHAVNAVIAVHLDGHDKWHR